MLKCAAAYRARKGLSPGPTDLEEGAARLKSATARRAEPYWQGGDKKGSLALGKTGSMIYPGAPACIMRRPADVCAHMHSSKGAKSLWQGENNTACMHVMSFGTGRVEMGVPSTGAQGAPSLKPFY